MKQKRSRVPRFDLFAYLHMSFPVMLGLNIGLVAYYMLCVSYILILESTKAHFGFLLASSINKYYLPFPPRSMKM